MTETTPMPMFYQPFEAGEDLRQGDILESTEPIQSIMTDIHPHFADTNRYRAFLILTQSCDLVRRGDKKICRSRYINLAVIRPLEHVLWAFLNKVCEKAQIGENIIEGVYHQESKYKAEQLLERIVRQNEQTMGAFYLYPYSAVKIAEHSVALLQVSIALRAQQHYESLMEARCGRLSNQFRDRLGWLIGNLFSRVATDDLPRETIKKIISLALEPEEGDGYAPYWVPYKNIKEATKKHHSIKGLTRERIVKDLLEKHEPRRPKDIAIERAISVIQDVKGPLSEPELIAIQDRLKTDSVFQSVCR